MALKSRMRRVGRKRLPLPSDYSIIIINNITVNMRQGRRLLQIWGVSIKFIFRKAHSHTVVQLKSDLVRKAHRVFP